VRPLAPGRAEDGAPGHAESGAEAELADRAPEDVTAALVAAGVPVRGLAVTRPSLEDLFVQLTGEGFDVAR
jgi:ABC-2 type transport system ATP-binding protein